MQTHDETHGSRPHRLKDRCTFSKHRYKGNAR